MIEEQTAQDPLPVRLRSVPKDWREMREVGYCHHRNVPYGVMLHEAADEIDRLRENTVSRAQLNLAVNRSCTCGGREPGTPSTCPACEVWHRLFGELSPPKPVPIANTWTGIVKGSVGVLNT